MYKESKDSLEWSRTYPSSCHDLAQSVSLFVASLTVTPCLIGYPNREDAFAKIKSLITQAPILHYYDVDKDVTIECDSSDVGLGAVLTQDGHPIAYTSQALTRVISSP